MALILHNLFSFSINKEMLFLLGQFLVIISPQHRKRLGKINLAICDILEKWNSVATHRKVAYAIGSEKFRSRLLSFSLITVRKATNLKAPCTDAFRRPFKFHIGSTSIGWTTH